MAIASLRTLATQVPDWQNRLDKLVAEIKARQNELADFEKSTQPSTALSPPADDAPPSSSSPAPEPTASPAQGHTQQQPVDAMNIDSATSALSHQPTVPSVGTSQAFKTLRPEPVYFDGSMQKFFEDLVHFIAVSRNMMRKAKMAARVAQIKKMAEVEIKDDGDDATSTEGPTLRYVSARRIESALGPGANNGNGNGNGNNARSTRAPDVFDGLDKKLDLLQTTSELAAFQFLRDASNNKHMKTIKKILAEVLDTAKGELARLQRDEPGSPQNSDASSVRTKRPLSMRKELPAGAKPVDSPNKRPNMGQLTPSTSLPSIGHMEIDMDALQKEDPIVPQVIALPANVPAS